MNFTILRFDSLESTNTEAAQQAKFGAGEGLCVVAREQTAGRGRHGRVWVSEKDAGLFFSLVLRPRLELRFLPLLTLMSAVAVYETLRQYGLKPDIKWANDIHVNEKKICGILAETCDTKFGLAVIVGIGINLKTSNFPPELKEIATSVEQEVNQTADAEKLLQILTGQFSSFYTILCGENGAEKIRQQWIQRSTYAYGKKVTAHLGDEIVVGTTRGIEADGALRVEAENGEIKIIRAGEVQLLRRV